MPLPRSVSAANIVIRPRVLANNDDVASPDSRIRQLLDTCGSNLNDRALVFISASISDGINTGPAIIARGVRLGLNPRHLGLMLSKGAGDSPARHYWKRTADGTYISLG